MIQDLKENWLVLPKMTWEIWHNFTGALESLNIGTLMACFCPKLKMYELNIFKGVICHDNEEWYKNWTGISLSVKNWHEEFDKFWHKPSKILKLRTLMDRFWPESIMSITEELCLTAVNIDAKFEGKSLVLSKMTRGIWQVLTWALKNFKNLHFNGLLLTKLYNVWAKKKYRGVMFDGTEDWCKTRRKTNLFFS